MKEKTAGTRAVQKRLREILPFVSRIADEILSIPPNKEGFAHGAKIKHVLTSGGDSYYSVDGGKGSGMAEELAISSFYRGY